LLKNLLITGGVGFIGINAIEEFLLNSEFEQIIIIDDLKFGQKPKDISIFNNIKIIFIKGDINDSKLLLNLLRNFNISHIVHLAAESHVDESIINPEKFITTNILGTFNLLESFKKYWLENGMPESWRFLYISTDEVFGSISEYEEPFNENSLHNPSSPYSASKSSGEQLVKAWYKTYKLPVIIINSTNNYGPYQYADKLIPVVIKSILKGQNIPVYGNGENIRDWIYVKDNCAAIRMTLLNGHIGNSYCVGAESTISNIELIKIICSKIDSLPTLKVKVPSFSMVKFIKDRPGHDFKYSIKNNKIKEEIGWAPKYNLNKGLTETIKWFLRNKKWLF